MRSLRLVALLALPAQIALGQQTPSSQTRTTLTLEEAIGIARRNNPLYQQTENSLRISDANVRQAYGNLLPSSTASFSTRYQQGGQQFIQGVALGGSGDQIQSNYFVGLNYGVSAATFINPRAARASRDATEANITGAAEILRSSVTQQYITALQAQARADVQDTLVQTAAASLELAKAKVAVGAGTTLDVRRAEVSLGQGQVASITQHNLAEVEVLRLYQQMGVPKPDQVVLTTRFTIAKPTFSLDSLIELALRTNPVINALRSTEHAQTLNVQSARMQYTPQLFLSTGWGGNSFQFADDNFPISSAQAQLAGQFRSCVSQDSVRTRVGLPSLGCQQHTLTDAEIAAIKSNNNKFPFKFTRNPMSFSAGIQLPIFDNFRREQSVTVAQVQRDNARFDLRSRELQTRTDVTQAYRTLLADLRTTELQDVNAAMAKEALDFASERYRVGAANFLEVITARGVYEQAQIDRVNALYEFHKAFAALESAVGRPLR